MSRGGARGRGKGAVRGYFRLSNQSRGGPARFGLLSVIYELPQSNGTTDRGVGVHGAGRGGGNIAGHQQQRYTLYICMYCTSTIIIRHCI